MEILFYQSMTGTLGLCIIQDDLSSLYSRSRLRYKFEAPQFSAGYFILQNLGVIFRRNIKRQMP